MVNINKINECYIVFGTSGAGKSSMINQICGEELCKKGDGFKSETKNCKLVRVDNTKSRFHGKFLVDMQGFNDTSSDQNNSRVFEKARLYFLESNIKIIKGIIMVFSITDSRLYLTKMIEFMTNLFEKDLIIKNSLVLLTKGDRLQFEDKDHTMGAAKDQISKESEELKWEIRAVEWSNKKPIPNQEDKLISALEKLKGFDVGRTMEAIKLKIEEEVKQRYEAATNIMIVHHEARGELQTFTTTQKIEDVVVVKIPEVIKKKVKTTTCQTKIINENRTVHFEGDMMKASGFLESAGRSVAKLGAMTLLPGAICKITGVKDERTQTEQLRFTGEVMSIEMDKTASDVRLLDSLTSEIDSNDRKNVEIVANFSWSGGPITTWNFDVVVTAQVKHSLLDTTENEQEEVVMKEELKKVEKVAPHSEQKWVETACAYDEKLYKQTKEQIRKAIISERILALS